MSMRQELLDLAARTRSFSQRIARETVTGAPSAVAPLLVDMVRRGQLVRVGFGAYAAPEKAEEARQHDTDGPAAQAGLIIRTSRGYALTNKGARRIPVAPPVMPAMVPYRPPLAAPRRPGSMAFLSAPSVYSGSARA